MSAASQAKRRAGDDLEVVALERSHHVSYSACGIPYWVGGDVESGDDLVARTPRGAPQARHRPADAARGHRHRRRRATRSPSTTSSARRRTPSTSTSSSSRRAPCRCGRTCRGSTRTASSACRRWTTVARSSRRWSAIGRARQSSSAAGYIGIEMAEAMVRAGCRSRSSTAREEPMTPSTRTWAGWCTRRWKTWASTCAPSARSRASRSMPVACRASWSTARRSRPTSSCSASACARTPALAEAAGLPLGASGGLRVDRRLRRRGPRGHLGGRRLRRDVQPGVPAVGARRRWGRTRTSTAG